VELAHALLDSDQSHSAAAARLDPDAVAGHDELEHVPFESQRDLDAFRVRVTRTVRQRLLDDAVDARSVLIGSASMSPVSEVDRRRESPAEIASEPFERGLQARSSSMLGRRPITRSRTDRRIVQESLGLAIA
jgi:hypothetical protein